MNRRIIACVSSSFLGFGCAGAIGNGPPEPQPPPQPDVVDHSTPQYSASAAVQYADAHWNDGQGLCAEFTARSLRAGNLQINLITYVPTLVDALSQIDFEEHYAGDAPSARAGDVVVYSDASGDAFCSDASDEYNCGHACIIVVGGGDETSIEIDCHNNAHYHMELGDILGADYSTYRIYHVAPSAPPDTVPCSTDYDCNQGQPGSEDVCAAGEGYCIKACHSDFDCPGVTTCAPTSPHWSCQ